MTNWKKLTRGERNNNPGNIKEFDRANIQWVGERATDDDPVFEEFRTPFHGIRALARVLMNYQRIHKLRTIRGIIKRWAPAEENNTDAYVRSVVARTRVGGADSQIDLVSPSSNVVLPLVKAIIHHENGRVMYSDQLIVAAIDAAR